MPNPQLAVAACAGAAVASGSRGQPERAAGAYEVVQGAFASKSWAAKLQLAADCPVSGQIVVSVTIDVAESAIWPLRVLGDHFVGDVMAGHVARGGWGQGASGRLYQVQLAALLASAMVWAGSTAVSAGVQQAVVPQHASLSAPGMSLVPRVSASALTT